MATRVSPPHLPLHFEDEIAISAEALSRVGVVVPLIKLFSAQQETHVPAWFSRDVLGLPNQPVNIVRHRQFEVNFAVSWATDDRASRVARNKE